MKERKKVEVVVVLVVFVVVVGGEVGETVKGGGLTCKHGVLVPRKFSASAA